MHIVLESVWNLPIHPKPVRYVIFILRGDSSKLPELLRFIRKHKACR